jgi:AraC-like DNA-binding protein
MSSTGNIGGTPPTDVLELRAEEQRRRLHNSVAELRTQVREKLDVRKNARNYIVPASGIVALVGLVVGYTTAGIFTRY